MRAARGENLPQRPTGVRRLAFRHALRRKERFLRAHADEHRWPGLKVVAGEYCQFRRDVAGERNDRAGLMAPE